MAEYNHNQTSSSASWVITHNLNSDSVVVDAIVNEGGNLEKILPQDINVDSVNQITITFSAARSGRARIVGEF